MSRERRHDPGRKQRILDVALDVIADHGLLRTTHRLIAAAADVPLGSLTYHFAGLDDLCRQAFEQHARRLSVVYAEHLRDVADADGLLDAVTDLVCGTAGASADDWTIAYELYLAALRRPELRSVTQGWMAASRTALERYVDPTTARGLDALIEGLIMHSMLATEPPTRPEVRELVRRQLVTGSD